MSNINTMCESLFRSRNEQSKLRSTELAYYTVYHKFPDKFTLTNSSKEHKLFNSTLQDKNLNDEWLERLTSSLIVPSKFEASGGYDSKHVSYITFDLKDMSKIKGLISELNNIPHTFVYVDTQHYKIPKVCIASDLFYSSGDNSDWTAWWDSITSLLSNE